MVATSNGTPNKEVKSTTTDNITGQRSLPEQPETGAAKQHSQEKTLFGVIVQNGARSPSGGDDKQGLTHAEVVAEQERRSRHSNHTSASSTPKSSPKIKKQKLKLGAHFRNSEF